jgi:hypothetical protein
MKRIVEIKPKGRRTAQEYGVRDLSGVLVSETRESMIRSYIYADTESEKEGLSVTFRNTRDTTTLQNGTSNTKMPKR